MSFNALMNPLQMFNNMDWNKYDDMSDEEFNNEMGSMMSQMFNNMTVPKKNPDLTPEEKKFISDHEKFLERMDIVKQLEKSVLVNCDCTIFPRGTTFVDSSLNELTINLPDSTEGNFKSLALINNFDCKDVYIVSRKNEFMLTINSPNLLLKFEKGKYIQM